MSLAIPQANGYSQRVPLEDHIGDICRKARLQTQTPIGEAASLAGLSEQHLQEWETEGVIDGGVEVEALANRLGLNVAKAQAVAEGWEPEPADLTRWRELRMVTTEEGFAVNSFMAWDPDSRLAAIFDTGWFADDLFAIADENDLSVEHLFITHMHGDHVAAMGAVRQRWPEIQLHSDNSSAPERSRVQPGVGVKVGVLSVTAWLTPGHAEDGVTYVIEGWAKEGPAVAVVGDAIFAGSMGKDFQSPEIARAKVREEILSLPPATLICPGHGPLTTVGEEQAHNPFF
jgi:glyoxylase-like metal-dependent hydrolase (beta-lactamase superfamily II)